MRASLFQFAGQDASLQAGRLGRRLDAERDSISISLTAEDIRTELPALAYRPVYADEQQMVKRHVRRPAPGRARRPTLACR
jgi:hypothetical protein